VTAFLKDKRILVTGGAGAFGQKFWKAAKAAGAARLTIYSRDEMKHAALRRELGSDDDGFARIVNGDITDEGTLRLSMNDADLVIHAAAMKHVGECERNVLASTRVNVLGTANVVTAFLASPAQELIFLSTDKAPYASSAYGAQKYLGERLVVEAARLGGPKKRAFCLRYSNVMDSTGSVFHLFNGILRAGKTATVNGAQTTRGFVTQTQVIGVIAAALQYGRGGEVFVLRPQVVRIAELAETLRDLLGQGQVSVADSIMYQGEKESATLIMGEELPLCRAFSEPGTDTVLVDCLGRHKERDAASGLPSHGLLLDDCARLGGAELKTFVQSLL
jgi:UDP-N-acetylglucosamine 4,6-dehydratase